MAAETGAVDGTAAATKAPDPSPPHRTIAIPDFCLVLLIGASGAGKAPVGRRWYGPTEVVSSDTCRALVGDDEAEQTASTAAVELLAFIADKRLAARRLTVIDATNVRPADRKPLRALAKKYHAPVVALLLLTDRKTCVEHNRLRPGRTVPAAVIARQHAALKRGLASPEEHENFEAVQVFEMVGEIAELERVTRDRLPAQ